MVCLEEQICPWVGMALQGEVPVETADSFLGSGGLTTIGEKEKDGAGAGVSNRDGEVESDACWPSISAP